MIPALRRPRQGDGELEFKLGFLVRPFVTTTNKLKGFPLSHSPAAGRGWRRKAHFLTGVGGVGAPSLPLPGLPCLRRLPAANRGPIHSCLRRATEHFPTACLGSQTPGSQGVIFLRADFFKFHFLPSCWCPTPISS